MLALAGVGEMRVKRYPACRSSPRPRVAVNGSPRPGPCLERSPKWPDQPRSTCRCSSSAGKAPSSSSDGRVCGCQVAPLTSTPAPRQADSQASRRHRSASSGSQQRRRAAFSRPVCSREMSREDPSSGDMVCQAAVDGLYTIDGACGIRGLCTGETEAQHRRFIHSPR